MPFGRELGKLVGRRGHGDNGAAAAVAQAEAQRQAQLAETQKIAAARERERADQERAERERVERELELQRESARRSEEQIRELQAARAMEERLNQLRAMGRLLAPPAVAEYLRSWRFNDALAFIQGSHQQLINFDVSSLSEEERDSLIQGAIEHGREMIVSLIATGRYTDAAISLSQSIQWCNENRGQLIRGNSFSFLSIEQQPGNSNVPSIEGSGTPVLIFSQSDRGNMQQNSQIRVSGAQNSCNP